MADVKEIPVLSDEEYKKALGGLNKQEEIPTLSDEELAAMTRQPTSEEKLKYGMSKATTLVGDIFRVTNSLALSSLPESFRDQRTKGMDFNDRFKYFSKAQTEIRDESIYKDYPWARLGEHELDPTVMSGKLSVGVADPLLWLFPWAKLAESGRVASFTGNALFGATDASIRSIADTGEIDPEMAGWGGAIGGMFSFLDPLILKMSRAFGSRSSIVKAAIDDSTDRLSSREREILDDILSSDILKSIKEKISYWGNNKDITDNLNWSLQNIKAGFKRQKEINKLAKEAGMEVDKSLASRFAVESTDAVYETYAKSLSARGETSADYILKVMEEYSRRAPFTSKMADFFVDKITSNLARPAVYAGIGAGVGELMYDDPNAVLGMALGGAILGRIHRNVRLNRAIPEDIRKRITSGITREGIFKVIRDIDFHMPHTLATKLSATSEQLGKFSRLMFNQWNMTSKTEAEQKIFKAPVESRQITARNMWGGALYNILDKYDKNTREEAVRIIRGYGEPGKVVASELARNLGSFLKNFRGYFEEVGIDVKSEIDNYFPRLWNRPFIADNQKEFMDTLREWMKTEMGLKGEKLERTLNAASYHILHGSEERANSKIMSSATGIDDYLSKRVQLPILQHIELERALDGPNLERTMEKFLINDPIVALHRYIDDTTRSVEFIRTFGKDMEGIKTLRREIHQRYNLLREAEKERGDIPTKIFKDEIKEIQLMYDAINAYFGRYGKRSTNNVLTKGIALATTLANIKYMPTVSLSALMDLLQPIQNSNNWESISRGIAETSLLSAKERLATSLSLHEERAIIQELHAMGVLDQLDESAISRGIIKTNDWLFHLSQLPRVTRFARRFAFNIGMEDVFKNAKRVTNPRVHDRTKASLYRKLGHAGVDKRAAEHLSTFGTLEDALSDERARQILEDSGFRAAERDAKIPGIGNRLLFTQSRNPLVRALGQYSSWAMAKSAQVNKLIERMEDGDMKLAFTFAATIPIAMAGYELRYMAINGKPSKAYEKSKYGEMVGNGLAFRGDPGWLLTNILNATRYAEDSPLETVPLGAMVGQTWKVAGDVLSGKTFQDIADGEWEKAFKPLYDDAILYKVYVKHFGDEDPMEKIKKINKDIRENMKQ